ncbi:MAG TPA: CPXCG motif-containing cysteine-rich protein [Planctomycetaceae bacterium]|nr:CPXCG motif-containing cysteine-rich protein [Planctomycetaceae bacterium]
MPPDEDVEQSAGRAGVTGAEASYICDSCGEEIVIPVDISEGDSQTLIEDCPVCCRANTIHLWMQDDGEIRSNVES